MALFRMAFFRLFALVFRHFAWRISFFRLFAWRYFVFSLFRLAFFRYFVFSLGVISSWRRAITPGEKTKERNNEMAQTSHHSHGIRLQVTVTDICLNWLLLVLAYYMITVSFYNALKRECLPGCLIKRPSIEQEAEKITKFNFFQNARAQVNNTNTGKCIRRFGGIYAYCRYFIDRKW